MSGRTLGSTLLEFASRPIYAGPELQLLRNDLLRLSVLPVGSTVIDEPAPSEGAIDLVAMAEARALEGVRAQFQRLFATAFEEWDRRYRENPQAFMDVATHLLKETPHTYGAACSVYFIALLDELAGDGPWVAVDGGPGGDERT